MVLTQGECWRHSRDAAQVPESTNHPGDRCTGQIFPAWYVPHFCFSAHVVLPSPFPSCLAELISCGQFWGVLLQINLSPSSSYSGDMKSHSNCLHSFLYQPFPSPCSQPNFFPTSRYFPGGEGPRDQAYSHGPGPCGSPHRMEGLEQA